jgi:hypothetical protein
MKGAKYKPMPLELQTILEMKIYCPVLIRKGLNV